MKCRMKNPSKAALGRRTGLAKEKKNFLFYFPSWKCRKVRTPKRLQTSRRWNGATSPPSSSSCRKIERTCCSSPAETQTPASGGRLHSPRPPLLAALPPPTLIRRLNVYLLAVSVAPSRRHPAAFAFYPLFSRLNERAHFSPGLLVPLVTLHVHRTCG